MSAYDFDLFVIGAGSGGVRAARIAAGHGARVAIAEERHFGGTCVNVGCVPKKFLVMAAEYRFGFEDAAGFGWSVPPASFDWASLIAAKDKEITRLNGVYRRLLEGPGVTIFDGRARLGAAPHSVVIGDRTVTAERILIATGGRPDLTEEPGAREHGITSDEVFFLKQMPRRIVIAGGGYIASEFASIFNGLGAQVTQLYRGSKILRGFDEDVRDVAMEELRKSGIDLRLNTIITRIDKRPDGTLDATFSDGTVLAVDAVLYAIGRVPMTDDLGLTAAGVEIDQRGAIKVDDQYRTNVPHIYALGDVTNRINLTPVALAEGHVLADRLYANRPDRAVSYENIPTAVFTIPAIATVGLTEADARARFGAVDIYKSLFRPMRHTLSGRDQKTFMKLVVDRTSRRVLGAHMVGADTPEMIQAVAIALNLNATKEDFDRTIGLHPTAAEEFVTLRTKSPDPA